ncbi:MAG: alpha/beta hydrolase [Chitinophagaceae bacterium]|nr:alpha/beta hydrolase [Chitinophagaceae bacterium]
MKYFLCLLVLFFALAKTEAQYRVVFKVNIYPSAHSGDSIFVAGNFNNWNPGNKAYVFSYGNNDGFQFTTQLAAGNYEYKCTRGSWRNVETQSEGKDIANRSFTLLSDTVIEISIEAWKDDFASAEKKHTASSNVRIMDTAFLMPQLNRSRKIWVYLPEDYTKSKKHYPVLYMQDGQNLFDEYTSPFGEWGVDECLDSLIAKGKPACIVVGIENGTHRFNEYNPFYFERFGNGEGDAYLAFLTETLKPYIDKNYRTIPSKENTIIAGSSMGGLISYYAMLKRPDVFGKGGIFSPAFWTAATIKPLTDSLAGKMNGKFFFYMGGKEGGSYIQDMLDIQESLGERSSAMIYSLIDPDRGHNEQAWRKWFAEFYGFIMADGFNNVVRTNE